MAEKETFEDKLEKLTKYSSDKLTINLINKGSAQFSANPDIINAPRGYSAVVKLIEAQNERKQYWALPNVIHDSRTNPVENKLLSIITSYEEFSKKEKEAFQENCLKFIMPFELINENYDKVSVLAAFIGGIDKLESRYNAPIHKIGNWDYKTIKPLIFDLKEILKDEKSYTWTSKLTN